MDYNLLANLQYCKDIVDSMMSFILYAHIPSAVVALIVGSYVLYKTRLLAGRVLFALAIVFSLWVGLNLSVWLWYGQASSLMSAWSVLVLLASVMFILVFYFVYVLVFDKNMPVWMFAIWSIILLPILFFTPTHLNLMGFDIRDCVAVENTVFTNYYFAIGILVALLLPIIGYIGWRRVPSGRKAGIPMAIAGAELFLLAFFTTSMVAQYLVDNNIISDFGLELYGIISMSVFMAFLAYVIVKYEEFKIKVIATQALMIAIAILIATGFTFVQGTTGYVLVTVTLTLVTIAGVLVVRSVKGEISEREKSERLAQSLKIANEALEAANKWKESLIHAMNHQIKGYLGVARNVFAELLTTDYGQMPEQSKPIVTHGFEEMGKGVEYVQGILNSISAQNGMLLYNMKPVDLKSLISDLVSQQKEVAEKASLSFESTIADGDYTISGDVTKLEEAFKNLITNAILYNNPNGSVAVSLSHTDGKVLFAVKDTGVGISKEDQERLFKPGGMGKDSIKHNANASGYGLAFVEPVIKEHQGKIWYETEVGKGTTFFVELPMSQFNTGGQPVAS